MAERPTRILFCSYAFHPSLGGIETVALFLAEAFVRRGLDVVVVTNTAAEKALPGAIEDYPYPVHRRPSRGELMRLVRESDLVFQCNISLNYLWPLLLLRRPLVVANHTPIDSTIEKSALKRRLKFMMLRYASAVSVSRYLAGTFPTPSRVIYNPLRADIFHKDASIVRDRQLLFVGRLAWAKGVDTLLLALKLLGEAGYHPQLTVVGGGAEESKLKKMAADYDISEQVCFTGPLQAPAVAGLMNRHEVLVVPSRRKPAEALGIVAMEGLACGAVPVVANQGGLPEAIGPCGLTFECENAEDLKDALLKVLSSASLRAELIAPADQFLQTFDGTTIVNQYLDVLAEAMPGKTLIYKSQSVLAGEST